MKIFLISYSDYDYDGRLRALIDVFSKIGELRVFMRKGRVKRDGIVICDRSYGSFILNACRMAKQLGDIDLLVLDNRRAILPGMLIRRMVRPRRTILDCRELYLLNEVKSWGSKIGCMLEGAEISKADIIICANSDRAEFMERYYRLSKTPLVYENLRQLRYDSEEMKSKASLTVSKYLHENEYRIISTSGCDVSRTNDVLVKNMGRIQFPCRLFLVGGGSPKDEKRIKTIITENGLQNVEIIPRLGQNDLKALIQSSHIGIVNYHQNDYNNKFCASGKLYEFIYEGIPVVTTTNPPLRKLCEDYQIGVADDSYANGINRVIAEYDYYRRNVRDFAAAHTVERNDEALIQEIKRALNPSAVL